MGNPNYRDGFEVTLQPHAQTPALLALTTTRVRDSMSDLFHEDVPVEYIQRVFTVMHEADWHEYQVLTKRAERLEELNPLLDWAPHIWMGVSVRTKNTWNESITSVARQRT